MPSFCDRTIDVSVVIPVYNDPKGVQTTIESILDLESWGEGCELLVVDNGSTDETYGVAKEYEENHPKTVSVFKYTDVQSSYAARNAGVKRSTGEIISFIDADMSVPEGWLEVIRSSLTNCNCQYVGIAVEISTESESLIAQYDTRTAFPIEKYIDSGFVPTCTLSIQRSVIDEIGLFDQSLISGGDREFCDRAVEAGFDVSYISEISVSHPARTTSDAQWKKSFRIGRGSRQLELKYPDRYLGQYLPFWSPLAYSPPRISTVREQTRGWSELSLILQVFFWLFFWSKKIAYHSGRSYETIYA